jgi:hypothetical protein
MGRLELADATTWTGDATVEPADGDLIVTPANDTAMSEMAQQNRRMAYFKDLLQGKC